MVSSSSPDEPPSNSSKKKHLTDSELALRREETARKRKNLSEKKLEDEKVRSARFIVAVLHSFIRLEVFHVLFSWCRIY
jgi:hypothetical protein